MLKQKFIFAILIISSALLYSCGNKKIFSDYKEIKDGVWAYDKGFSFIVDIEDTMAMYEIDLLLRNTDDFPNQNLWLQIEQEHNGNIKKDTINAMLLDGNGKWIGGGIGGDYDNNFIWKKNVRFHSKGSYVFQIKHLMRCDILEGITRIGIVVEKEK